MNWYPCCCGSAGNYKFVPCCIQGIQAVITARAVNGAGIRPNTIILSKPAVPGAVSSNHGGVMVFDVADSVYSAGSYLWYFWGLEPITHDEIFKTQAPANWHLKLGFKNIADIGYPDQLILSDVHLEFGFFQGSDEQEVHSLYPSAVSGTGWTDLSTLIGSTGSATSPDIDFCGDEVVAEFDFGPLPLTGVTTIVNASRSDYKAFTLPSKLPPHSPVQLCFKGLETTTDAVDAVSPVSIEDCQDPICSIPVCNCAAARQGDEFTCDSCICYGSTPIKIGGYGLIFPERPMYVWTDFGNTLEWTVYGYAKRRNNPTIGMLFWTGKECRELDSFNYAVELYRSGTGTESWTLDVQGADGPPDFDSKTITATTVLDSWFFFSIRKRKRGAAESFAGEPPGGWEFTFQIDHANNRADPLIVYTDISSDYTILGETGFGDTFTFAGPAANNSSIAGCIGGLTFVSSALSNEFLDAKVDMPCDVIPP